MIQFINGINLLIPDSGYLKSGNIKLEDNTISSTTGDLLLSASSNVKIGENRVATVADLNSATGSLGTMSSQNSNNVSITGGTITGITDLAVADGGTGASTAETARSNLGLTIGTNVQAYDDTLNALANVNVSSNQLIYATGSDTFSTTSLTSFGRSLIDDADASTARGTLGLIIGTNVQAQDATLQALAGLSTSADQLIYATGSDTFSTSNLTSFGRSLIDDADASTARTTLGLGTIATQNSSSVSVTDMIVSGDLTVQGNTTTLNTETLTVEDKNIVIAKNSANDAAADGGGITLESGDGDKTFNWVNVTDAWTSSEHLDLASGKNYQINGNLVLSSSALGSNVTISSLTQVGTITSGTWEATDVAVAHGGTGASTAEGARNNLGLIIGTNVQAYDDTLNALANVNVSSNQLIYATGSDTFSTTSLTSFGRSLIDDADASTARTTLGLGTIATQNSSSVSVTDMTVSGNLTISGSDLSVSDGGTGASTAETARSNLGLIIGTNVQAQDATLQALAGLSTSADQLIYATGSDTFSTSNLTSFGRSLIDDADASAARTTLGLIIGTNVQAQDATLQALAGLTTSANQLIYATGSDTFSTSNLTSFGRSLIDDADASAARTTLGLGTIATQNSSSVSVTDMIVSGNLTVQGNTTTLNTETLTVEDKNIVIAKNSANDAAADGGGITLESGDGDKTFNWVNVTDAWTSSEHLDLASGKSYYINGNLVLSSSTLGSNVTTSSLTQVGTITSGTWAATDVAIAHGGTGASTAAGARTNLELGTIATQNSDNVSITGGTIDGVSIGNTNVATIVKVDNVTIDGNSVSASNSNGILIVSPNGTGALQADSAGNTRGQYAIDLQRSRSNVVQVASGNYSVIGGGQSNQASGIKSFVGGGYLNASSGTGSAVCGGYNNAALSFGFIGGGSSNASSGSYSTVGGGFFNTSSGYYSTVGGGLYNTSSGVSDTVGGGSFNTSSGYYSTVGGGGGNTSSGSQSTVGGGKFNTASSYGSTVGGGRGNTASNNYSTVGGGTYNTSSGANGTVGGGSNNTSSGSYSTVGGGFFNTSSGYYSTVGGGRYNTSSGFYSISKGYYAVSTMYGQESHASGRFAASGDAQKITLVARRATTNNTANQVLFLDGTDDRLVLPAESTWNFNIQLSAYNDTDNAAAGYSFRGVVRRNNANGTALVGDIISESWKETAMDNIDASVVADDTNESLEIRVTGLTSKNIRWVATVEISQVTYA